jgi:general secretion pathway protein J
MSRLRGFTLVEILVAIAIFAVLGIASSRLLDQVLRADEASKARGQRLGELQRAMGILERDALQVVARPVRDELGEPLPAVSGGVRGMLEFTRAGWRNPTGAERAELQRVAYMLEGKQLLRFYWPVLDRAEGSEPVRQVLLDEVEQAEVEFVAADGETRQFWPQEDGSAASPGAALPRAVRLRLVVAPWGEIERLFALPDTLPARFATATGDPGGGADGGAGGDGDGTSGGGRGGAAESGTDGPTNDGGGDAGGSTQ